MASTTRRTKAARADRRTENEQRIHDAIVALVGEGESFTELSVERIVAKAGISRSTFYVYFADKGEVLRALGGAVLGRIYDGARSWFEAGDEVTREDIERAMRSILDAFRGDEVVMTALAETAVYDPEVRDMYRESVEAFIRSTVKLIQRGQRSGRVRALKAADVAPALSWMIERTTLQQAPGAPPKELDRIAAGLAEVIWGVLYVPEAPSPIRLRRRASRR